MPVREDCKPKARRPWLLAKQVEFFKTTPLAASKPVCSGQLLTSFWSPQEMLKNTLRGWWLLLALLACNQLAGADDEEEHLLQKAAQASARGDFDQAIGV